MRLSSCVLLFLHVLSQKGSVGPTAACSQGRQVLEPFHKRYCSRVPASELWTAVVTPYVALSMLHVV